MITTTQRTDCFIRFKAPTDGIALPERFTFPFYYQPHPLSELAARELQDFLAHQTDWVHNFGITNGIVGDVGMGHGKMFGVLVVRNEHGELGYLAAFSGKLAGGNHHPGFVPPVFDLLLEDGFYRQEEEALNDMNRQIEALERNPQLPALEQLIVEKTAEAEAMLAEEKEKIKAGKAARKREREQLALVLSPEEMQKEEERLVKQSLYEHYLFKDLKRQLEQQLDMLRGQRDALKQEIQDLKEARRLKSGAVQQKIFDHYYFLNRLGHQKSLADIFQQEAATPPPAGAGECAAPKLLQYAFLHHLEPIALAEFWWGVSHAGEIRKHGHFYPACRGKCEPILAHMLEGTETDPNPMLTGSATDKTIEIVYEDEHLLVINKPTSLLSVPGKNVTDSVFFRMKKRYPEATGPLVVHRLDMSTSGLMLIAKNSAIHKNLQGQFIKRTVKKRYTALLDGLVTGDRGVIDLPLRVDLDDRPRQMVCYEYGKNARTEWEVVSRADGKTTVYFYPITGRTHQLRVHAAHPMGLNTPITGDDIYGVKGERLHLHAGWIEFVHPVTKERMVLEVKEEFNSPKSQVG